MTKPGTDQHEGRVVVWETDHNTSAAANFVDLIHIDIRIAFDNLQCGYMLSYLFTDGGGRHLADSQSLCNVLHTSDGYTCQVHLNEELLPY